MPDDIFSPPPPPIPFIGRKRELAWLEREAGNREWGPSHRPLVITGPPGIGKTALVAKWLSASDDQKPLIIGATGEIGRTIADSLLRTLGTRRILWLPARQFEASARDFDAAIRARSDDRSLRDFMVVLDGVDELTEEQRRKAFSHIFNFKYVRAVIATSRVELETRGQRALRLEGLPTQDAESLISGISGSMLSPDSLDKILGMSAGHPLMLSLLAKLAGPLDSEHLRNVLNGHLYDLNDTSPSEKKELISIARPIIISANEAMIAALKKQPEDIFKISPRKFEELVAELMHDMGYDVTLTPATRDGGKDILASMKTACGDFLMLVEAKHYRASNKIGVSLVRTLYGTLCDYQANSAMLVTTSSFSKDARTLQQKHQYQLKLSDYTDVAGWIQRYGKRS